MVDMGYSGFEWDRVEIKEHELVNGSEARPLMLATSLKNGATVDE
jgi:hypothetical protein